MPESTVAAAPGEYDLDILGQQMICFYTQLTFCFSTPDGPDPSYEALIHTLSTGLERLSASFPWLAGTVVHEGAGPGTTGVFKIKSTGHIPLTTHDLRDDPSRTMAALRASNFPMALLDETVVAPRRTIPTPDEPADMPVLLVQANLVQGGLLLTVNGQHQAMDLVGQGEVIRLFDKACRGEPFTEAELASGKIARREVVPLLGDDYEPGPELAHQLVEAGSDPASGKVDPPERAADSEGGVGGGAVAPERNPPPPDPSKGVWTYFTFDAPSLDALKSRATPDLPASTKYISTDDVLSAFVWQSVARARLPRVADPPSTPTLFGRAVDSRRFLNVSATYPGLLQTVSYHESTFAGVVVDRTLGGLAAELRAALDPKTSNVGYRTRALATVIDRRADKSGISMFVMPPDPSLQAILSSWAKLDCYGHEFGLGWGKPVAVRRPRFVPFESLMYLMPRAPDGGIAVAMCLGEEDTERLKGDEEWVRHARYVG